MSLNSQLIPVQFQGGLDTKSSKQLVVPGKFLVLENCIRRKTGRVQKRNGFENLGTAVVGDGTIDSGIRLSRLDDELVLLNNDKIYSRSEANDNWIDKGDVASVSVSSSPVLRNSLVQSQPDICTVHGITVSVWESYNGTATEIRCSVFDESSKSVVLYNQLLHTTASRPKVVAIENSFIIVYLVGTGLKFVRLDAANPTQLYTEDDLIASGNLIANRPYDILKENTKAILAYAATSGQLKVAKFNYAGVIGNGVNGMPATATIGAATDFSDLTAISVAVDIPNTKVYVTYSQSSGTYIDTARTTVLDSFFITQSSYQIDSGYSAKNLATAARTDGKVQWFSEISAVEPHNYRTRYGIFQNGAVVTASADFLRSVGLVSKAIALGTDVYVSVTHESVLQSTYFVVRDDKLVVAKMAPGVGDGLTRAADSTRTIQSGLSHFYLIGTSYTFAASVTTRVEADDDGTVVASAFGIQRFDVTFDAATLYTEQLGKNLHISSGVMLAYDGVSVTELGFHLYPENVTAVENATAGAITGGLYRVTAVYEWVDGQGQTHQSAPAVTVNTASITASKTIDVVVPTLRLTSKTGDRTEVRIVVYRSTGGDVAVLYRDLETENDTELDEVTIQLTQSDDDLRNNQILYTTGDVLENIAPSSSSVITKYKNRLVIGGLEDGSTIAFSKPFVPTEGVAFNDGFVIQVEPRGGDVTALSVLDDKLIIFKKDFTYALTGDGPLDTGAQNDFSQPQLISGDIGCVLPESIVILPTGLMFKSDKGIYHLSRSLQFSYLGAPVEEFNGLTVTSGVLLEDVNEARFTTDDRCLVYNYYFDQWSVFTNYSAVSAIQDTTGYLHLKSNGQVCKETDDFTDAGSRIRMAIETSWFAFANLQGVQRIYEIACLGDYVSNHVTKVKLAYDYEEAYTETIYFNVDEELGITYYGDDATYGDSDVYGGSGSAVYQFYIRPRRQKCVSMKVRLEDIDTVASVGGGSFNLVSMTMEVGAKKGTNHNRTIGSL